ITAYITALVSPHTQIGAPEHRLLTPLDIRAGLTPRAVICSRGVKAVALRVRTVANAKYSLLIVARGIGHVNLAGLFRRACECSPPKSSRRYPRGSIGSVSSPPWATGETSLAPTVAERPFKGNRRDFTVASSLSTTIHKP